MFSKLSLMAFLLCSIINLHAALAQLPFPNFKSGKHSFEIQTDGSVQTDATVENRLAQMKDAYLIKVRPKIRSEADARWWMGNLIAKWKSQGFRPEWHLAVVCEDPPLVIVHSPSQRPGNVMDLLEAITSQGTYRETIKHKDELDQTVAGLKARLEQTDKAAAELARVQGITLQDPIDFVTVVKQVKDNCEAVLSKKLSEGEQKQLVLKQVIALLVLVLLTVIVWAIVSSVKEKRRLKKTYFDMVESGEKTLNTKQKYDFETHTGRVIFELRRKLSELRDNMSISPEWMSRLAETLLAVARFKQRLDELSNVDEDIENDYPFKLIGRLIAADTDIMVQRRLLTNDPLEFDIELWTRAERSYTRIGTAIRVLGEAKVQQMINDLPSSPHEKITREALADYLASEVEARQARR